MEGDPNPLRCFVPACRNVPSRGAFHHLCESHYQYVIRLGNAWDHSFLSEAQLNTDPQMSTTFCGCDEGASYLCQRHRIDPSTQQAEAPPTSNAPAAAPGVTRKQFLSGMVRDQDTNKIDYTRVLDGPMLDRWAEHLTKNEARYPDVSPGVANWTLANGREELERFRKSAFRHLRQWLRGDDNEDHAAAVFFNINGYEYVRALLVREGRLGDAG